jgi:predicted TIM-barrel fold metal-dependent hydrolase
MTTLERPLDQTLEGSARASATIDACVHHEWPSTVALSPYIEPGWREMILREGDHAGPNSLKSEWLYLDPRGWAPAEAYPEKGPAGSDPALTLEQAVSGHRYAVLGYREGLLASGLNNFLMARAVTQAANRWTIDEWLSADSRLRALVLIANAVPRTAASDIREFGAHPQMVGIAMGANGLGRPFGHACYDEIYEAAVELDLPIVVQAGSDAVAALDGRPTAGGLPATYAEYATHSAQTVMGHVASFIVEGAFEKFPTLRILCVGGGAAWLPPYAWRMDYWYNINAHELPWLKTRPSEYLAKHIRIGTSSLERPRNAEEINALWKTWPEFSRMLVYTSEYPSRDAEAAASIAARIPAEWHQAVLFDNAAELFSLGNE